MRHATLDGSRFALVGAGAAEEPADQEGPHRCPDALDDAARWLRQAVAVPYDASDPGKWLQEFQACIASARRMLGVRAAQLREQQVGQPRLIGPAEREADEHEQVARMADGLFADAYLTLQPKLLEMVDLTEAAKELDRAVDRLRRRRSDLLYEGTHQDIGGAG